MTLAAFLPIVDDLRARGKTSASVDIPTAADVYARLVTIIDRAATIAAAVAAYESQAAARVAVPFFEVTETVAQIEAVLAVVTPDLDYPFTLVAQLRDVQRALFDLAALRRLFASQVTPTSGQTNAFTPGPAPLIPYRLRQGDTLERLARATLGDAARAYDIIALNTLDYPHLDTERDYLPAEFDPGAFDAGAFATATGVDREGVASGVRVTGEVIWLPADATVPQGQAPTDRDVELWGRDLTLAGGFLVLSGDGEAQTVEGRDNIVQALGQRLGTGIGELLLHPDYGMRQRLAVGIEGTRANVVISGLETARTVLDDPRVTYVRNIGVLFRDTVNRADMQVGLIGASDATLPVNLVIPEAMQ